MSFRNLLPRKIKQKTFRAQVAFSREGGWGKDRKMDSITWHCWKHDLVHTPGKWTTDGVRSGTFCSLSLHSGRSIFAQLIWREDFGGRTNSSGQTEQLLKVRFALLPSRRAPAKRQERSVCHVLLYFFCSPAIIPDCTSAWFLLLANFPILFRCFIPSHLKVSPKSGQGHSPISW